MRLFVSADLDGAATAIEALQEPLSGLSGIRCVDPEQAHVTITFLGGGDHDLDALSAAIESAIDEAETGSFDTTIESVGAFPSTEYIRVIWAGIEAGAAELSALHRHVESKTTALGYDEERHEFAPHITLARMEHGAEKVTVQRFLEDSTPEIGPIHIEELRLKESTLTDDGPEYRTVRRFEL